MYICALFENYKTMKFLRTIRIGEYFLFQLLTQPVVARQPCDMLCDRKNSQVIYDPLKSLIYR